MKDKGDTDRYSEEETTRRADEVIRRMINMPPQPKRKASTRRKLKPVARSVKKTSD
jgi:hypothetical protein